MILKSCFRPAVMPALLVILSFHPFSLTRGSSMATLTQFEVFFVLLLDPEQSVQSEGNLAACQFQPYQV